MNAIEEIHMSLVSGQNKQAAAQIKEYGVANFVTDYTEYLREDYLSSAQCEYITRAFKAYAYNI